jgi:hypothetical protein
MPFWLAILDNILGIEPSDGEATHLKEVLKSRIHRISGTGANTGSAGRKASTVPRALRFARGAWPQAFGVCLPGVLPSAPPP